VTGHHFACRTPIPVFLSTLHLGWPGPVRYSLATVERRTCRANVSTIDVARQHTLVSSA
jgi:hypothetical protein